MSREPTGRNVRKFGNGPRAALAIHCTLAHSGAWSALARLLGDRLTITAYDLPGHGRSPDWDGVTDLHDLSTQMGASFLDAPMDLIGHSFGATVALRLAVEMPQMVRSLTLIEPVFFAPAIADQPERVAAHHAEVEAYTQGLASGDMETAARVFNRVWGDGTRWVDIPAATRDYMTARIHVVPGSEPALFHDRAGLLAPGRLDGVAMPCLLIQGETSPDVIVAITTALARRLRDTRRAVIKGAGHMAPLTHPKPVAAAILGLLDES